jgi:hypothetical protein
MKSSFISSFFLSFFFGQSVTTDNGRENSWRSIVKNKRNSALEEALGCGDIPMSHQGKRVEVQEQRLLWLGKQQFFSIAECCIE